MKLRFPLVLPAISVMSVIRQDFAAALIRNDSCFKVNSNPGCADSKCQHHVCSAVDSYCCDVSWDVNCVDHAYEAVQSCQIGRPPPTNNCFEIGPLVPRDRGGGCNDLNCQMAVCSIQPSCCSDIWDFTCVDEAVVQNCTKSIGNQSCFEANNYAIGCKDPLCRELVCNQLPQCCDEGYNRTCVDVALTLCPIPNPSNSCFEASLTPNCTDPQCLDEVCKVLPECCAKAYNSRCVAAAKRICTVPNVTNSCFEDSLFPNCTDPVCLEAICAKDPSCCENRYDLICVNEAREMGQSCRFPVITNPCSVESNLGGCIDETCSFAVCSRRSSCCNNSTHAGTWDESCIILSEQLCVPAIVPRYVNGHF